MTIQEIQAKQAQMEVEQNTALEAAKTLTPATPEFDEAYGRYLAAKAGIARIPDEIAKAKLTENAEAIGTAGNTVAEAITQLVEGLKVEDLLGTAVIALRYFRVVTPATEAAEAKISTGVVFNPIMKLSTSKGGGKKTGMGRTIIVAADGSRLSLTKFVLATATEAEIASVEYKYPHVLVATKPKFEEYCTAHNLTGYSHELPGKAETEVEAS